jgi:hypothetical protein
VDGVSIFVGGCGDVCCGSLSSLTMGWIGLDWTGFGCVMRCEAMRNDMTRTRHEALVSTRLMRDDARMARDWQAKEGGLALHSLG